MSASTFCACSDRKIRADVNLCLNMGEAHKIRARRRKLLILVAIPPFLFDSFIRPHCLQNTPFLGVKSWWGPKRPANTLHEYFLVIFVFWCVIFSLAYASWTSSALYLNLKRENAFLRDKKRLSLISYIKIADFLILLASISPPL